MNLTTIAVMLMPLVVMGADAASGQPGPAPTETDPSSYQALGWFVAAMFGVVGLANQGLELWRKLFPAVSPPLHQVYATKEEVNALRDALAEEMERITDEVDATTTRIETHFDVWLRSMESKVHTGHEDLHKWQLDITQAVARLGAKVDAIPTPRR